jgi:hypothetical protein
MAISKIFQDLIFHDRQKVISKRQKAKPFNYKPYNI